MPTFSPRRDDGYGGTHLILALFPTLNNIFAIHFIKSDVGNDLSQADLKTNNELRRDLRRFSGETICIYLLIRIFLRKLHHHTSGCSDNFPGQENVFQSEHFNLLPVFRYICEVHLEQQKQIISQHHQLKDGLVGPKRLE